MHMLPRESEISLLLLSANLDPYRGRKINRQNVFSVYISHMIIVD